MQVHTPYYATGIDPSRFKRQRRNAKLTRLALQPLDELRGTEFDPWSFENGKHVYTANPTWEAAVILSNRRWQAYMELVPVSQWPVK